MARRDVEELGAVRADVLVLLGNGLPGTARVVADAWHAGVAPVVLISGGVGHSTSLLWEAVRGHPALGAVPVEGRPEGDIFREILVDHLGVDAGAVLVENESTNCGANAWASRVFLNSLRPSKVVLIQDPTMQRRSHASFERAYRGEEGPKLVSFSPFVPEVSFGSLVENFPDGLWGFDRFVDLVLGEIPRLHDVPGGYGPRGKDFIEHVEVPADVLVAYEAFSGEHEAARNRLGQ